MAYFLDRLGVHIARNFGHFVKQASQKVIAHAEALARKAGRPFVYQDRVVHGKDELARQIAARDGITQGLICVFSTVEPAMCFALVGAGAIRPRLRKCLHLYFYVIDRELGFHPHPPADLVPVPDPDLPERPRVAGAPTRAAGHSLRALPELLPLRR
jgi:hypothetical protein